MIASETLLVLSERLTIDYPSVRHLVMLVAKENEVFEMIVLAILVDVAGLHVGVLAAASDCTGVPGLDMHAVLSGYYTYNYIVEDSARMKFWVSFMFSFAALVVIVIQAAIYWQQAEFMEQQTRALDTSLRKTDQIIQEMKRQSAAVAEQGEILGKQFQITDRPWLRVDVTATERIHFTDQGAADMAFKFTVKNIGRSVAVNAAVSAHVIILQRNGVHPYKQILNEQKSVCENVRNWAEFSYTVFPSDDFEAIYHYSPKKAEFDGAQQAYADHVKAYVVGCVEYQFVGHTTQHQTRFARKIGRKAHGELGADLKIGEDVPQAEITLQKKRVPGDYAD